MAHDKRPTLPHVCPCCGGALGVTELRCGGCGIEIRGDFAAGSGSGILSLNSEDLAFAEIFLRCCGNLREVQSELGQSYPTIKKQLDRVVAALRANDPPEAQKPRDDESAVINDMRSGRLTVGEAVAEIKRLKKEKGANRGGN